MAEYIEREKVIKLLNDNIGNTAAEAAANGHFDEYFDGWTDATSSAIMGAESIPAADVRPERHSYYRTLIANTFMGRLDKDRNPIFQDRASYVCAECGRGTIVKDNFCSHCGAKMDGKSNVPRWIPTAEELPPENQIVDTKIDDEKGGDDYE